MRRTRGRVVHVESLADFDARIGSGARTLTGWRVRGLDLSGRGEVLDRCQVAGASFLGCTLAAGQGTRLTAAGALVLPAIPDVPVDVYRSRLYTAEELYAATGTGAVGGRYAESLDGHAYAWSQHAFDPTKAMAQALHDHAIDQALEAWLPGRRVAGVMGGHALQRGSAGYAAAARLGRELGRAGLVVATGGGPGAMEAANLGARLAGVDDRELATVLDQLAAVPSYRPDIDAWARVAFEVCRRHPAAGASLGIPTWHYGHEPPNVFATEVAKYFRNAVREAILVQICDAGIAFLPGAGGTVQEIFQDGCENYYADESSVAPMVLVGERYWTEQVPAWPLLRSLARGRSMEQRVHLVDSVPDAAALLAAGHQA